MKRIVYSETLEKFNDSVKTMKENDVYRKYANFKKHVEENILPRHKEWSLKERLENRLPTHNQNTTNYVEYSFRMTKDIQFSRLRTYNLTDLVDICLDDSKFYSRRCVDVSHNRNYHLFTNQDSQYLYKPGTIDLDQIIQQSRTNFLVPSETFEDKLYSVDMVSGICECVRGCSKGPCKHKKAVAQKFKMNNFEMLPKDNEIM